MATLTNVTTKQTITNKWLISAELTFDDTDDYDTGGVPFTPNSLGCGRIESYVAVHASGGPALAAIDPADQTVLLYDDEHDEFANDTDISDYTIHLTVVGY